MTQSQQKLNITPRAAKHVQQVLQTSDTSKMMRVRVDSGGCSGFQYVFDFDEVVNEDDLIFEENGVKIVVDEVSINFLEGAEIDFVEELIGSYFKINNPNATTSCGCGSSFTV